MMSPRDAMLYRLLLRAFPSHVRRQFGADMTAMFGRATGRRPARRRRHGADLDGRGRRRGRQRRRRTAPAAARPRRRAEARNQTLEVVDARGPRRHSIRIPADAPAAGSHGDRHRHPRARHRRQHGDLFRGQRGAAPAAPLPGARAGDDRVGAPRRRRGQRQRGVAGRLPRLGAAECVVRVDRRAIVSDGRSHRRRRAGAAVHLRRVPFILRRARRPACLRPPVPRRRSHHRQASRRHPRASALGRSLRQQPGHRRPVGATERNPSRSRRSARRRFRVPRRHAAVAAAALRCGPATLEPLSRGVRPAEAGRDAGAGTRRHGPDRGGARSRPP